VQNLFDELRRNYKSDTGIPLRDWNTLSGHGGWGRQLWAHERSKENLGAKQKQVLDALRFFPDATNAESRTTHFVGNKSRDATNV
jgi:hypothetical protein